MRQIHGHAGVIDSGYRGIIYVVLHNLSEKPVTFNVGDKIAQLLFGKISLPVLAKVFDFENNTESGSDGFGSTSI